jgi:perosamine synthetase
MHKEIKNSELGVFDISRFKRECFRFLKSSDNSYSSFMKSIASEKETSVLVPLGLADMGNPTLMGLLTEWRNNNIHVYQDQTLATVESTTNWFQKAVIDNEDRILFLIFGKSLCPIGHIGLSISDEHVEVDNVVRGVENEPGIMSSAMRLLESWCFENLNQETLQLRVIENNTNAIDFYRKLGWNNSGLQEIDVIKRAQETNSVEILVKTNYVVMNKVSTRLRPLDVEMILTAGPSVTSVESLLTSNASRYGWNAHHSDYLAEFEKRFAEYVGSKYAVATSSGSASLHLSLLALGIGPGDEVIVPNITWVATASAVTYVGAKPIFADVDSDSWGISSSSVRRLITNKTKAIIPVHLYGFASRMTELLQIAKEFNLAVVEDAAPAIGTILGSQAAGTLGDIGCFSFQGAKMLVTGEGGMVVTDSPELYERVRKIQDHGRIPGTFWIDEIGHKYKMSNMTASFGIGQLASAERQISKKRQINSLYTEALSDITGLKFQFEIENSRSICWMSSVTVENVDRERVFEILRQANIDTRPTFPAISEYPIWGENVVAEIENAKFIANQGINLPSGVGLSRDEVLYVCQILRSALK